MLLWFEAGKMGGGGKWNTGRDVAPACWHRARNKPVSKMRMPFWEKFKICPIHPRWWIFRVGKENMYRMQFHKRTQPFIYDTPYIYIYIFSYTYIHIDRFAQQRSTTLQPSFIGKHRWPNIDPMNRGKRSVATIPVIRLNMYLRQFNSINLDVETAPAVFIEPTPPLSNLLSGGQTGGAPSTPAFLFHPPLYKRVDCVFIYSLHPCASKRTRGVHPFDSLLTATTKRRPLVPLRAPQAHSFLKRGTPPFFLSFFFPPLPFLSSLFARVLHRKDPLSATCVFDRDHVFRN